MSCVDPPLCAGITFSTVHLEFEVGKIVTKDIIAACASTDDVPLHRKSLTKIDHGKGSFLLKTAEFG